jgi:hypothetical protein
VGSARLASKGSTLPRWEVPAVPQGRIRHAQCTPLPRQLRREAPRRRAERGTESKEAEASLASYSRLLTSVHPSADAPRGTAASWCRLGHDNAHSANQGDGNPKSGSVDAPRGCGNISLLRVHHLNTPICILRYVAPCPLSRTSRNPL